MDLKTCFERGNSKYLIEVIMPVESENHKFEKNDFKKRIWRPLSYETFNI